MRMISLFMSYFFERYILSTHHKNKNDTVDINDNLPDL